MSDTSEPDAKLGWRMAAGVASTSWTAIVTIAVVPVYLRYLGVEAYGLIGFYTAMQALFVLLEFGLAQSINREVARAASEAERLRSRNLLHTLALGYWAMSAVIAVSTWAAAPLIARHWLTATAIDPGVVSRAVALMGLIVACRLPLSLYLGALMGARRMVVASGIEIAMTTLANVGAIAVLAALSPTIQTFFVWQAMTAVVNVAVVRAAAWRALGRPGTRQARRFDPSGLRRIWRFSAAAAVTAITGAIFVQSDKIILSKIVSLSDLGRYALAGMAARSLYILVAPVFAILYPQLASLQAAGATGQIERLYRSGTRLMMAIVVPAAMFVAVFSTELVTLWTGDAQLAAGVSLVARCLLLGTVLNSAMHFPYALQLAYGKSDLPMITNIALLVLFAPLLSVLSIRYGIMGAAVAWSILNVAYLVLGAWLTHRTVLVGLGARWVFADVGIPVLVGLVVAGLGGLASQRLGGPIRLGLGAAFAGLSVLAVFMVSPGLAEFARSLFISRSSTGPAESLPERAP